MIVLDTNVLSELMRPTPVERVTAWLKTQPVASVFTTTITEAEILYGVALLPGEKRKAGLERAVEAMFREDFAGRVLSFDSAAAHAFAVIAAGRRQLGKPISQLDTQIAAICSSRGADLATRNGADFMDCGIRIIDPWRV